VNRAFSIAKKVPLDLVAEFAMVGENPAEIREKLEPFIRAGADQIVLTDVYSMMVSAKAQDYSEFLREMSPLIS